MAKKKFAWLVLLFSMALMIPGWAAQAASDLKVSATSGFDGKSKQGKGTPLLITIENNGSHFSGDLVIDIKESYSLGAGRAVPLDIGTGETKTISLVLPNMEDGYSYGQYGQLNAKQIFLYEGGWAKGKEVSYQGTGLVTTSTQPFDTVFVLAFTNDIDRLASIKNAKILGANRIQLIDVSSLNEAILPDESTGWELADVIVIDEYPLADLETAKQEAILGWVRSGGLLVIGASDNTEAESGLFSNYLSFDLKGETETNSIVFSENLNEEELVLSVPSYKTELRKGAQSVLVENGQVLIGYQTVGNGKVLQTAFSVGDEPLAKLEGMQAVWNKLFREGNFSLQAHYGSSDNLLTQLSYTIGEVNELFPSFKVSTPLMSGVIFLYIILIIPVLYFFLKRKDKREHTWWIIPVFALLTSIAIFGYGAKDRIGRAQVQQTALVNIEEDGEGIGYFAQSVLSNKSGDFTFTSPVGTALTASQRDGFFGPSMNEIHKQFIVEKDAINSKIHFRNVGYWNVATVYGEAKVKDIGKFTHQLSVQDKQLTGFVTNEFPFALTDVSIWSGSNFIPIGDLGPGETMNVEETLKTSTLLPNKSVNRYGMNPLQTNPNDLEQMRKDQVLAFSGNGIQTTGKPVLIGYANTEVIGVALESRKMNLSALTMITQPIDVDVLFNGTFQVEPEMMDMTILSEDTNEEPEIMGSQMNDYYFQQPVYIQTWQLSENLLAMKWKSFTFTNVQKELYEVSLLNLRTDTFDVQEDGDLEITENIEDYLSPSGKITFRIAFRNARDGNMVRLPELSLTGEGAQ